ncbi:stromal cell-derived factor 2-like protein 1 [Monodelphis domestica]|uniref:Stromal cell derived factor 2 like 1 n=1 Tax=Monodelphis domestica TaxID=13616 RepID=A0A5F8GLP6_MONDO|nr:stromal cell-derived factor 2-like protein 1 [Monodelphis domestica]
MGKRASSDTGRSLAAAAGAVGRGLEAAPRRKRPRTWWEWAGGMWRPGPRPMPPVLLLLLLAAGTEAGAELGTGAVTCGSVLKLLNTRHGVRLHSHDVKYGSGSGQQSVTGVEGSEDANSYWRIRGGAEGECPRGVPVRCGQAVRLTHVNTGKNLHTHHFPSPLSNNQEVSAFGDSGEGDQLDVWLVQCSGAYWDREEAVRFQHAGTHVYLSVTGEQYGHPIRGQREVHGMPSPNQHNSWKAMEGVFIKPSPTDSSRHDEL